MNDAPVPDRDDSQPEGRRSVPISSEELLGGQREIIIQHGSEQYRLRLTTNNKLILVK
jgi:hemin uptake protein HemP